MTTPSVQDFTSFEYDIVIVGGGTAGLTLAARLSEDPSLFIGIVEAGGDVSDMPEVNLPSMAGKGMGIKRLDWGFKSIPQAGANGREIMFPRGKGIGGSSALNFMAYTRGSSADYDAIEALGNPGWNWDAFVAYMKKGETFTPPPADVATKYHVANNINVHGSDGPLKVSVSPWHNQVHLQFMESVSRLGVPLNTDPVNGNNMGVSTGLYTLDPESATRSYAASAYYYPNAQRPNLSLLSHAHVARVIFDPAENGEQIARGVVILVEGKEYIVKAKKEVILSAGTFQTPQILELSGIGEQDILKKHGIQQLIDLPVGENLQDHAWVPFVHEVSKDIETLDNLLDPAFLASQMKLYQEERRGMLSGSYCSFAYVAGHHFLSPEVMMQLDAQLETNPSLPPQQKQFLREWLKDPNQAQLEILQFPVFYSISPLQRKPDLSCRYQSLFLANLHPVSRGSVHIKSTNPLVAPDIDIAFLQSDHDLEILVNAVRLAKRITETPPYSSIECVFYDPTLEVMEDETKLRNWVRERVEFLYHPVGTCAMAPREIGGVVDPELRVYGTKNLRVVDASILPIEISTHIQATVYALATKASEIIKQKYSQTRL